MELIFKEENKIYLLCCNIKIKQLNNKLNYKKLKLFKIEKVLKLINYKLTLFKIINIYLVFYISFLKLVFLNVFIAPITEINSVNLNAKYEVEIILNC